MWRRHDRGPRLGWRRGAAPGTGRAAPDQVALVLRVVDRRLDVVPGECTNRVDGLPEGEGDHLRALAVVAAKHPGTAVARGFGVLLQARPGDVVGVLVRVGTPNGAPPDSRDHDSKIRITVSPA